MPGPQRMAGPVVIERLREQPQQFSFFQAVRLLERWLEQHHPAQPAPGSLRGPDGSVNAVHGGAVRERMQFLNNVSLDFPASEVAALQIEDDAIGMTGDATPGSPRIRLTPGFIGLLGVAGGLPSAYTEQLLSYEQRQRDPGVRAFYDWLSHPGVALFYEAWKKHRLHLQYERDGRRHFLPLVLALAGLGAPGLRERQGGRGRVADEALAYNAAALQRRRVGITELGQILGRHFDASVEVQPFIGAWYAVPTQQAGRLGQQVMRLGVDAMVGGRVWQRHLRVRLRIGPLPRERYREFLPGGNASRALQRLLLLLANPALEYELQPVLRREDMRGCLLGGDPAAPASPDEGGGLGLDSFLMSRPADQEGGHAELIYLLNEPDTRP